MRVAHQKSCFLARANNKEFFAAWDAAVEIKLPFDFFAFSWVSNLVGPWQTNPCWQLPMPSIGSPLPYLRCPVSLWLALVQLAKAQSTKWADKMAQMKQRRLWGGAQLRDTGTD